MKAAFCAVAERHLIGPLCLLSFCAMHTWRGELVLSGGNNRITPHRDPPPCATRIKMPRVWIPSYMMFHRVYSASHKMPFLLFFVRVCELTQALTQVSCPQLECGHDLSANALMYIEKCIVITSLNCYIILRITS